MPLQHLEAFFPLFRECICYMRSLVAAPLTARCCWEDMDTDTCTALNRKPQTVMTILILTIKKKSIFSSSFLSCLSCPPVFTHITEMKENKTLNYNRKPQTTKDECIMRKNIQLYISVKRKVSNHVYFLCPFFF